MEFWTAVRYLAHFGLLSWAIAILFLAVIARGQYIRVTHVPIAATGLICLALWLTGLIMTVKGSELLPRSSIVPVLATLEFCTALCAWGWTILCSKRNFRFVLRPDVNVLTLIECLLIALVLSACTVDAHVVVTQPTPKPSVSYAVTPPVSPLATPKPPRFLPNGLPIPGTTN